jgi:hypothetical protein
MSRDEPIIQIFHDVYREVMGIEPVHVNSPGITDSCDAYAVRGCCRCKTGLVLTYNGVQPDRESQPGSRCALNIKESSETCQRKDSVVK